MGLYSHWQHCAGLYAPWYIRFNLSPLQHSAGLSHCKSLWMQRAPNSYIYMFSDTVLNQVHLHLIWFSASLGLFHCEWLFCANLRPDLCHPVIRLRWFFALWNVERGACLILIMLIYVTRSNLGRGIRTFADKCPNNTALWSFDQYS